MKLTSMSCSPLLGFKLMPESSSIEQDLSANHSDSTTMKNLNLSTLLGSLRKHSRSTLKEEGLDHLGSQHLLWGMRAKNLKSIRPNHLVHTLCGKQTQLEETPII